MPVQTVNTSELASMAAELVQLQERIAVLTGHADALKDRIRESVPAAGKYEAGELTVLVSTNSRFDPEKALDMLELPELAPLKRFVVRAVPTVNRTLLQGLADDGDPAALNVLTQATKAYPWRVSVR